LELSHSRIYDWEAGATLLPSLEKVIWLLPRKAAPVWIKLEVENVGIMLENLKVEISPC
jgi:hypothetical protein